MSKSYSKTRVLVECALMVAIGTVLANIKIFTMPNGGSVTLLSMLPFVLVSFRHGVKWGLFTGLVNGCLQMLLGFWYRRVLRPSLQEPDGRRGCRYRHRRLPALHVQLPVRRPRLGQPE